LIKKSLRAKIPCPAKAGLQGSSIEENKVSFIGFYRRVAWSGEDSQPKMRPRQHDPDSDKKLDSTTDLVHDHTTRCYHQYSGRDPDTEELINRFNQLYHGHGVGQYYWKLSQKYE